MFSMISSSFATAIIPNIAHILAASPLIYVPMAIGYLAATAEIKPCYNESDVLVAWQDNPTGYNFSVTSCDYQINQGRYVLR